MFSVSRINYGSFRVKRFLLWVVILFMFLLPVGVFAKSVDYLAILRDIDELRSFDKADFSAVLTMISEDPEKGVEKKVVQMFRRDRDDKFLMLIKEPEVQRGQGYLKVGKNMWFYDPESRKFSHISLKENFAGTDAKNSDFGKSSLAEDYDVISHSEGKLGRFDVYILELKAKNNEVTYPYMKVWVTKKPHLVLKVENYSLNKRLLRVSYYPKYARVGNSYIATRMIFIDSLVKNKRTQITLTDLSVEKLPNYVFTKSYVERVNR